MSTCRHEWRPRADSARIWQECARCGLEQDVDTHAEILARNVADILDTSPSMRLAQQWVQERDRYREALEEIEVATSGAGDRALDAIDAICKAALHPKGGG
jgi:hypothetical protein